MNSDHRFIRKFSVFPGLLFYSFLLSLPIGGCTQQTFREMADEMAGDKIPVVHPSDLPASYVMLDAREVEEYRVSHINGAKYIGFDNFDISKCSIPKDQTIIIYCSVGYRSGKIAEKLKSEGYKNVYNLWGGIFNWVNSGKEVVNDEGPTTKVHPFDETWGRWLTREKRHMSDRKALIIMARSPIEGQVKTRLAASVGAHTAFEIYRDLLSHTIQLAKSVSADVLFFWTENSGVNEVSFGQHFVQTGDDLGMRMKNAFDVIFTMGYDRVVMIGTDCIDLFPAQIEEGFCALHRADIVYGPAHDGGYYLVGMKNTQSELFDHMPWSTNKLLTRSIIQCRESMLSFVLLPQLSDIDTLEDVQRSKLADRLTAG